LLIVTFAFVVWSVQTIDVGMDYAAHADTSINSAFTKTVAADGNLSTDQKPDTSPTCNAGCVCQVFHHAFYEDAALLLGSVPERVCFSLLRVSIGPRAIIPPLRPPLV
jgi:hypothetical protein